MEFAACEADVLDVVALRRSAGRSGDRIFKEARAEWRRGIRWPFAVVLGAGSLLAVPAFLRRGPLDKRVVRDAVIHRWPLFLPGASSGPILPGVLAARHTSSG